MMELTKEKALELHRQMWTDMQEELGNTPYASDRVIFKKEWCDKHFPGETIDNDCFLCEFSTQTMKHIAFGDFYACTKYCPIAWKNAGIIDCCEMYGESEERYYLAAPISEILALPEREGV